MKFQIGGTFSHRRNGFYEITDIRVCIPEINLPTKYYFNNDLEDFGVEEVELDRWIKEGWIYTLPEYYEKLESDRLREQALHRYPKNKSRE